jgi:FixJ family two-component response regulator
MASICSTPWQASGVSLPVVMVTAVGDEDLMAQGLRLGAVDHVAKAGRYVTTLPTVLQRAVTDHVATPDERAGLRRQRRVLYVEQDDAEIELTRAALAGQRDIWASRSCARPAKLWNASGRTGSTWYSPIFAFAT